MSSRSIIEYRTERDSDLRVKGPSCRVVFLDRDGVINKYRKDYVKTVHELEILPAVETYLKKLSDLGFKIIIVTNQSPINRKLMTLNDLQTIHQTLITRLKKSGCIVDDIFFCPHTPEDKCTCRKPAIGLFVQAQLKHNIRLMDSWMIGDSDEDIQAGLNAGCMAIRIERNGTLKYAYNTIRMHCL